MTTPQLHSSIQPDLNVQSYYWRGAKYYYIPLFSKTLFPEIVETALGAKNPIDRNERQLRDCLLKAKAAQYSHVKIPLDRTEDPIVAELIEMANAEGLKVIVQVCTSFLFDESFFLWLKDQTDLQVEWILDQRNDVIDKRMLEISRCCRESYVSVVVHRTLDWREILGGSVFDRFKEIHLYFSYQFNLSSPFLNCKEGHKIVGMLRKQFPRHKFLPPKGVDLWDHRARSDFDMEPLVYPCFQTRSKKPNLKFSVVIPTYNNQNHLRVVLRHLYKQNVGLDQFEVIVVDDGGTDQTQPLVIDLLKSFPKPMNFKYVFFQRHRERTMGDSQYRAGISRNVGVKNSEAEILCFLDSDIIVPSNYLMSVEDGLRNHDALQARRINLSYSASSLQLEYDKVNRKEDCIADEPYWEDFIKNTRDWNQLPFNWKYVCTHSFSLRKDVFWEVGGLKKNYIFYGFEDTDLGYRLVKGGYKLRLLDVDVFHMFHENSRSEFLNLKSLRHSLLSRTAQIFYLHHLDEDIFENLLGFMEPEPTFQRVVNRIVRTLSLQFLWRPRPMVYRSVREAAKAAYED